MTAALHESWERFLRLALVVAKHNARFRCRYPASSALYRKVAKLFFAAFNDMPFPLVVFAGVVEDAAAVSRRNSFEFSGQIADALESGRAWAGRPARTTGGQIAWKESISFVETTLLEEIESSARAFFQSVYCLAQDTRPDLQKQEREFWKRYHKMRKAHLRAKRDHDPIYTALLCLSTVLPQAFCADIIRYLV